MIENGTLLQDRYLIKKQIGAGGMGAVYLAVDQRFGSHVAIKETFYKNDELGDAFGREAHLLNSLLHPALPHVSDFFIENNGHFLVMQFIEGEDLSEIMKREGAFPVKDVMRWTDSLLDALDYLHSQEPPIIHRDIKPQNLKVTPRGDVILLDFGLAKLSSEDTTGVKSIFGYSRKYSPLEQIQGTGTDARSDLFALAATAYHLLTGKPPLDALPRASAIVAGNLDPLPLASELNSKIPMGVASVLNSALALNPAQRFVSAKAMRQALEHAIKADTVENADGLSQTALAGVAGDGVLNSVETEDFPALESFADKVKSLPQTDDRERLIAVKTPPPSNVQTSFPVPEFKQATPVNEVLINVSPRLSRSRFPLAALVTLLICVVLAAGYFINKANSSNESSQTPVVESILEPNLNAEQTVVVSDSPTPKISDSPSLKNTEQAEILPVRSEKIAEKRETVQKREPVEEPPIRAETTEKPKPAPPAQAEIMRPAPAETKRPAPAPAPRRSEPQRRNQTQPRVIESQRAPDIESIFTGRPTSEGDEKLRRQEERRRQREEMSDEEWREMRRQRRQERKQRPNRNPFPF